MSRADRPDASNATTSPSLPDPSQSDDAQFDLCYPSAIRALSRRHWTPVDVARRAARLFEDVGADTVLDVGAGVGKFAIVAASAASDIQFVGVEQRERLVDVARLAAAQMGVGNACFLSGNALDLRWTDFDGFYFFNPFAESLFAPHDRIDDRRGLTRERFFRDVLRVESELRSCPVGTAVVTYHGMGGRMPACFELRHEERARSDCLRLWIKRQATDDGSFYLEMDAGALLYPAPGRVPPDRGALS